MIENLFVIVGLSGIGKSTLLKSFCKKNHLPYFTNDTICRQIMDLCKLEKYPSIAADKTWDDLNNIIDVCQAKYWFHVLALLNIKNDLALADGYLYFQEKEREILQTAIKKVHPNCKVHYLHLKPNLAQVNINRKSKGAEPINEIKFKKMHEGIDLSFINYVIANEKDLVSYIESIIKSKIKSSKNGDEGWSQWISPIIKQSKNIEKNKSIFKILRF